MSVSLGDKITDIKMKTVSFDEIVSKIKNGELKNEVARIRTTDDERQKAKLKQNLPYFNMGSFRDNYRSNSSFISTRHLIFDIDHLNGQADVIRGKLIADKQIFCVFKSPSGDGLKFISKLEKDITDSQEFRNVYEFHKAGIEQKYGVVLDHTIDPARSCFLSYDPDIYLNSDAEPLQVNYDNIITEVIPIKPNPMTYREENITEATEFIRGVDTDYGQWLKIGFALASLGEAGRKYFTQISFSHPRCHDTIWEINQQFDECLSRYDSEKTTLRTFFYIAKENGYVSQSDKFWVVNEDGMHVSRSALISFLENEGYAKMYVSSDIIFIRVISNVVGTTTVHHIKDFVIAYVDNLKIDMTEKTKLKEYILSPFYGLFAPSCLDALRTVTPEFKRDTKDTAYFYFENCFVEVTAYSIKPRDYEELEGYIWDRQIIKRRFNISEGKTDFSEFLRNICRGDVERYDALRSSIGYLLHGYKDPSVPKAVIFNDEDESPTEKGRTGKSLCIKAISELRQVSREDGRNFKFGSTFAFQQVDLDTQIIAFNDVGKRFEFDKLFSVITDGLTIEKKNRTAFNIPYERSPKIVISTNFVVKGYGASDEARKHEIEFSNHYSDKHRPIDEFRKRFFDDWSECEWSAFYTYMMQTCQFYLRVGLKEYQHVNLENKKLVVNTSEEFVEYITALSTDYEYLKKDVFRNFQVEYPEYKNLKQNTFTKWLKLFCKINGYEFISERKNSKDYFTIKAEGGSTIGTMAGGIGTMSDIIESCELTDD
jgi:hypothetical protein